MVFFFTVCSLVVSVSSAGFDLGTVSNAGTEAKLKPAEIAFS